MTTFRLPKLFALMAVVLGFALGSAGEAKALDLPERQVAELGKNLAAAAHPTGVSPRMTDYSFRGDSLYMTLKYEGAFTGWTYTAQVRVDFDPVTGRAKTYSYQDDNKIVPSYTNIERELARWTVR